MISTGTIYRCENCKTEVEIISAAEQVGGPLVCCEIEMKKSQDDFDLLFEKEAYDEADFEWN